MTVLAGFTRQGLLTDADAIDLQPEAEGLMAAGERHVDSRLVLELVRDSRCTAYDCEYVALAMALGAKLVTMDAKLRRSFPRWAVPLSPD
ncbi:MAG: type II toxin-antitoxin system VapC family toxin [Planctomycetia bacterium]